MRYSGQAGVVLLGANQFCIQDWSFETILELADITNACSGGARERLPILNDWMGEFTMTFDDAQIIELGANMLVNADPALDPIPVVCRFYIGKSPLMYQGNGFLSKVRPVNSATDAVRVTASVTGNGQMSLPIAKA